MSHKTILNDKGRMEWKKDSDGAAETRWRRPDLLAMLDDFARERKGDPRIRRIETFVCVRGFPEDYSWPEPGDLLVLQIIGGTTFRAVAMAWNERGTYGICPGMSTEMEFDPREIDRLLVTDMSSTGGMGVPLDVMNWKTDAPDRIEAFGRTAFERWREKNLSRVLREHTQLMIGDEFLSLARGGIVESEEERCSCLASDPERAELARAREALTVLTEAGIPPDWERLPFMIGAKTLYVLTPRGDDATASFVAEWARQIEIGEWATWRDRALVNRGALAFAHWDEALRSRGSLRGFKSYLQMLRWPAIYFALEGSSAAGPDAPSESDATATPGPEAGESKPPAKRRKARPFPESMRESAVGFLEDNPNLSIRDAHRHWAESIRPEARRSWRAGRDYPNFEAFKKWLQRAAREMGFGRSRRPGRRRGGGN